MITQLVNYSYVEAKIYDLEDYSSLLLFLYLILCDIHAQSNAIV